MTGSPPSSAPDHGQLMDAIYARQAAIYDLTRKYYLLGRDRLIDDLDPPAGGRVLEIACGTGRNLIRIGHRYPQARLYGMDISSEMLAQADRSRARAGMADRLALARGDACRFDAPALFGEPCFERIVFSYCLSMIPDWQGALAHALPLLAPGGRVHLVDFGQMTRLPRWFGAAMTAWLRQFHVTPRATLSDTVAHLAQAHAMTARIAPIHRDYAILGQMARPGA